MKRLVRAFVALALAASAGGSAQIISGCASVPAHRVAASTDAAKLAADAACFDRAKAPADASGEARRARIAALAPPAPAPGARPVVVAEGDSISILASEGYTGLYAAARPTVRVIGPATGGASIATLVSRLDSDLAQKPNVVTVLIGANDLGGDDEAATYLGKLWAYVAKLKAAGTKVAVGTVLPIELGTKLPMYPAITARHKARRAIVNPAIRAAVGTRIDAVIDFAADPDMGPDAAAADPRWYGDGTHPTSAGQRRMAAIYTPVVDGLLGAAAGASPTKHDHPVEPAPKTPATASPTISGVPAVAAALDRTKLLQPSWGTGAVASPEEGGAEGAFRFTCFPSHLSYDDPVIYPAQPGKSHLHQWFGNTKGDAFSTYESLRRTGESTCNNALNRSAYWVPAMLNGHGKVVTPEQITIYYKGIPVGSRPCASVGKECVRIPRGLRYVFGYNMQEPAKSAPADQMWWNCDAPNAGGHFRSIREAATKCPVGAPIGMVLTGPGCWNGKELDSADHRSHMAYAGYGADGAGRCPKTHPFVIPHFTIGVWYRSDATLRDWYLASDRMPGMAAAQPGTTMHADWFGAWDDDVLATWQANCIDKLLSCAGGDLGNGKQLKDSASRALAGILVDVPARPD